MDEEKIVAGCTCLLLDLAELQQALIRIQDIVVRLATPISSTTSDDAPSEMVAKRQVAVIN